MSISVSHLISVCFEAGRLASARIKKIHSSGDLQCVEKGDGKDAITGRPMTDIQTEADRQSETIIFSTLYNIFPKIKVCVHSSPFYTRSRSSVKRNHQDSKHPQAMGCL